MQVFRGYQTISPDFQGGVVTLGNFDGVHRGHQAILKAMKVQSQGDKTLALIFEPQPAEFFHAGHTPARITRLREKIFWMREYGLEGICILPFNEKMASLSAEGFIQEILCQTLKSRKLIVGEDCHFGQSRRGDVAMLRSFEIDVDVMPTLEVGGARVSSTRIRQALQDDNLPLVKTLLGRQFSLQGRVKHGKKLGRTLGFPTANLDLHRDVIPVQGIYCVKMHGVEKEPLIGAANVGTRPTVNGTETLLEVHLLDWRGDLYGKHVEVEFFHKLRPEEKYETLEALANQIEIDVNDTRAYFKK